MFRAGTCGLGDGVFSFAIPQSIAPAPPPPPPSVVQVTTSNVVHVGPEDMPGGPIDPAWMPQAATAQKIACLLGKKSWNAATGKCSTPPKLTLRVGTLLGKQTAKLPIPVPSRASATTKILNFAPGSIIPGLTQGLPEIGFEQRDGLWIVSAAALPVLQGVLGAMVFTARADGSGGQANFVLGQTSGNAAASVDAKIAGGDAVLVDKASVASGVLKFVFTQDPAVVVQLASGPNAPYALVTDKPDAVVGAALASLHGGVVPASAVASSTPWLAIGLLGAGALVAAAIVLRKPGRAAPNRRRR